MATIRFNISEILNFMLFTLSASAKQSDDKEFYFKHFRLAALEKFRRDNISDFLQRYRIFIKSLQDSSMTTIVITDGDKEAPEPEQPSILKRLIKKLIGSSNEQIQIQELKKMIREKDEVENNTVLKRLRG